MDIDYILNTKPNISFDDKLKIISAGRPTPNLDLVQTLNRTTKSGRKCTRKFNKSAYESFTWMAGCSKRNSLFCFPCLLFSTKKDVWWTTGFKSLGNLWKDAKGHASNRHYKFIRLLDLNQFASFRSSFPRHELAVLLQMPYGRLFSASELEDEL